MILPNIERTEKPFILFELSSEICFPVGGVHTVVKSKAMTMVKNMGDENYLLIGAYYGQSLRDFRPARREDYSGKIGEVIELLQKNGVDLYYGRWLVSGCPRVLLLVPSRLNGAEAASIRQCLSHEHGIHIPQGYFGDLTICMARKFEIFISAVEKKVDQQIVAHFHEFTTGCLLLIVSKFSVRTLYTAHATTLGRFLAQSGSEQQFGKGDMRTKDLPPDLQFKYLIERRAAQVADVLLAVSDTTAAECTSLLGRSPDVVAFNGLNMKQLWEEAQPESARAAISAFLHRHFPGELFPEKRTFYFFSAGRNEISNKGYDLILNALVQLNQHLKQTRSDLRVICFFIIGYSDTIVNDGGGHPVSNFNNHHARVLMHPTADKKDEILELIAESGLQNKHEDPVRVLYHPGFLHEQGASLKMNYPSFVSASHLGIFPSRYEPWGYTPLECVCLGVPAITSSVSGFAEYFVRNKALLRENFPHVLILRTDGGTGEVTRNLFQMLADFLRNSPDAIGRLPANNIQQFDWENLVSAYIGAYDLAMTRPRDRQPTTD
jgi:glycogen synthase